jgi:hypothetical protein
MGGSDGVESERVRVMIENIFCLVEHALRGRTETGLRLDWRRVRVKRGRTHVWGVAFRRVLPLEIGVGSSSPTSATVERQH